jgi:hypothetical protein
MFDSSDERLGERDNFSARRVSKAPHRRNIFIEEEA